MLAHYNFSHWTIDIQMLKDKNYPDPSLCDTEKPLGTIVGGTLLFRFQSGGAGAGGNRLPVERIAYIENQFFANISSGWNFRKKSFKQKL